MPPWLFYPRSRLSLSIYPKMSSRNLSRYPSKQHPMYLRSFQVMLDVHEQVSRSPRPKLILEMAVAKLIAIRPAHSIDDLVSKITKMQGGGILEKDINSSDQQTLMMIPLRTIVLDSYQVPSPKTESPKPSSSNAGFLPQTTRLAISERKEHQTISRTPVKDRTKTSYL